MHISTAIHAMTKFLTSVCLVMVIIRKLIVICLFEICQKHKVFHYVFLKSVDFWTSRCGFIEHSGVTGLLLSCIRLTTHISLPLTDLLLAIGNSSSDHWQRLYLVMDNIELVSK